MDFRNVTIIIPTLNEERTIGKLLVLLKKYKGLRALVCDDGSEDKTEQIVRKFSFATFLDRSKKDVKGLTASVIDGIEHAKTGWVVVMDGDLQHPPEALPAMINALKTSDVVVGTRKKVASAWPLHRRLISLGATTLAKIMLFLRGTSTPDPMSGFFGLKKEIFQRTNKERYVGEGYKCLLDLLKQVKVRVATVPYTFGARNAGTSKLKFKHWLMFLKSLIT